MAIDASPQVGSRLNKDQRCLSLHKCFRFSQVNPSVVITAIVLGTVLPVLAIIVIGSACSYYYCYTKRGGEYARPSHIIS
jgi:hypothetical protein